MAHLSQGPQWLRSYGSPCSLYLTVRRWEPKGKSNYDWYRKTRNTYLRWSGVGGRCRCYEHKCSSNDYMLYAEWRGTFAGNHGMGNKRRAQRALRVHGHTANGAPSAISDQVPSDEGGRLRARFGVAVCCSLLSLRSAIGCFRQKRDSQSAAGSL